MSRPTAFALPAEARITVGVDTLSIDHDGDVVLEQTLGRRLSRLEAKGDVTLRRGRFHGTIHAGGTLRIDADCDVEELRADVIEIGAVEVRARTIVALSRVVVDRARITADVVVAPEVHIAPEASGRIRVVDARNERPATKVRGCLSLEDYEADFGDVADFLARRGVEPVSPLPIPTDEDAEDTAQTRAFANTDRSAPLDRMTSAPLDSMTSAPLDRMTSAPLDGTASAPPDSTTAPLDGMSAPLDGAPYAADEPLRVEDFPEEMATVEDYGVADVVVTESPDTLQPAPEDEAVEDLDDDAVVEVLTQDDDTSEHAVLARPARPSRVVRQVEKAWERMQAAYGDQLPDTVSALGALVADGKADVVAERIDALWLATLREHLELGSPPPRVVTLAFHQIRAAAAAA